MQSEFYDSIWVTCVSLVVRTVNNKTVFPSYSGRDNVFIFLIGFLIATLVYSNIDKNEFLDWYYIKVSTYMNKREMDDFIMQDTFYNDLLLCVTYFKRNYQSENYQGVIRNFPNIIYVLTALIQKTLNSCNKNLEAKSIIIRELIITFDMFESINT